MNLFYLNPAESEIILQDFCPEVCAPTYFHNGEKPIVYGELGQTLAIYFERR